MAPCSSWKESFAQDLYPSESGTIEHGAMFKTWKISLLLLMSIVAQLLVVQAANEGLMDQAEQRLCDKKNPLMDPTYEKLHGTDVVWQIPSNPKGVLFMIHGLNEFSFDFFDPGPKCEQCLGLPEARTVVLDALVRGYAVIAIKSIGAIVDTYYKSLEESEDLPLVTTIITEWVREHSLDGLPLVAWGHSGGTTLAAAVATTLPMGALVLMCGNGLLDVYEKANASTFPSVILAKMLLGYAYPDVEAEDAKATAVLTERGVQVVESLSWPRPLYPLFFTERIRCMTDEMSRQIFAAYQAAGWLDSEGYLTRNPATDDWTTVLWQSNALPICDGDLCLRRHVRQELKMSYARHSFTSAADDSIFAWLDSLLWPASTEAFISTI